MVSISSDLMPGTQRWLSTLGLTLLGYRPNSLFFFLVVGLSTVLSVLLPFGTAPLSPSWLQTLISGPLSSTSPQPLPHSTAITYTQCSPIPTSTFSFSTLPGPLILLTSLPTGKVHSCARIILL